MSGLDIDWTNPEERRKLFDQLHRQLEDAKKNKGTSDVMAMDYHHEYLTSPLWRKIKRRVLKRDGKICFHCGGTAVLVHHRSYDRDVLEGASDHMLASLCEGCHNIVHFDDEGRWRSPEEADQVLIAKNPPTSFPEPVIDLRRETHKQHPPGWFRMTAVQRHGWLSRASEVRSERAATLKTAKESALRRRQARATKPPRDGLVSLLAAFEIWKKEPGAPTNAYDWYRRNALTDGKVLIGNSRVKAEKIGREWFVASTDLEAAIAGYRQDEAKLDQISQDYSRGIYYGEDGQQVNTRGGWYQLLRPFRFSFSSYGYYKHGDEGGWFCNDCNKAVGITVDRAGLRILECKSCGHRRFKSTR